MAQRTVVESICDKCGVKEHSDIVNERAQMQLPDTWTHLSLVSRKKDVVAADLCENCTVLIMPTLAFGAK